MPSILVVDDDPALLRLVALLLRTERYEVLVASGGSEALRLLQFAAPSLILLDLSMPEMDGREFYAAAREAGYGGPVVICSAYGAREASVDLGANAAITKPFDTMMLLDTVHALVSS
jgi:two-component system, OmpR family, KDP operon response regulator KdpE